MMAMSRIPSSASCAAVVGLLLALDCYDGPVSHREAAMGQRRIRISRLAAVTLVIVTLCAAACGSSASSGHLGEKTSSSVAGVHGDYLSSAERLCTQAEHRVYRAVSRLPGAFPMTFPAPKFVHFYAKVRPIIVQMVDELDALPVSSDAAALAAALQGYGHELVRWIDRAKTAAAGRHAKTYQAAMDRNAALTASMNELRAAEQRFRCAHPLASTRTDVIACSDTTAGPGTGS
jgi:hypothetical protein